MVYEHIPWGVVLDENASLDSLRHFTVVLAPNAGIVSEREVALFRSYVEGGGKLIITGVSGCYDRRGRLQTHSALESLTGARFVRKLDSLDNWVRFPTTEVAAAGTARVSPQTDERSGRLRGRQRARKRFIWGFRATGPSS